MGLQRLHLTRQASAIFAGIGRSGAGVLQRCRCLCGELFRPLGPLPDALGIGGRSLQPGGQHGGLLLGTDPRLALDLQHLAQPLQLRALFREAFSLGLDLEPGRRQLDAGRFGGLLLPLDALRLIGQVNGLLRGFARQGIAFAGQSRHLLYQLVPLALQGLPNVTVMGFLGTDGALAKVGGEIRMPRSHVVHYPIGRLVDASGRVVVSTDARDIGGILPDIVPPLTPAELDAHFNQGRDPLLDMAVARLTGAPGA